MEPVNLTAIWDVLNPVKSLANLINQWLLDSIT